MHQVTILYLFKCWLLLDKLKIIYQKAWLASKHLEKDVDGGKAVSALLAVTSAVSSSVSLIVSTWRKNPTLWQPRTVTTVAIQHMAGLKNHQNVIGRVMAGFFFSVLDASDCGCVVIADEVDRSGVCKFLCFPPVPPCPPRSGLMMWEESGINMSRNCHA